MIGQNENMQRSIIRFAC